MREGRNKPEDDGSLSPDEMMVSFYSAFREMRARLGKDAIVWEDVDGPELNGWTLALKRGIMVCEEGAEANATIQWSEYGREIYNGYIAGRGFGKDWEGVPPHLQIMWTCLGRHLINLIAFDKDEDGSVTPHEERIAEFYDKEVSRLMEATA